MSAKLDVTRWSIVVWCDLCPSWVRMADSELEGHNFAVRHEFALHPELHAAEENRNYWRQKNLKESLLAR
jgi:hypothetical protein